MKSTPSTPYVMLNVQAEGCRFIISESRAVVEIKARLPRYAPPFKVYVVNNKKVFGEFICTSVESNKADIETALNKTYSPRSRNYHYFVPGELDGGILEIGKSTRYEVPMELSEFLYPATPTREEAKKMCFFCEHSASCTKAPARYKEKPYGGCDEMYATFLNNNYTVKGPPAVWMPVYLKKEVFEGYV